jgi:preprotein translocase subunit YajC
MLKLLSLILFITHLFASFWIFLARRQQELNQDSWFDKIEIQDQ